MTNKIAVKEQNELEFAPKSRPASRRLAFCPTCGRPFLRGSGVHQDPCLHSRGSNGNGNHEPENDAECPEYCSENCMPGIVA